MKDQASVLRAMMAASRTHEPLPTSGPPAIVVGSGKGGVGKSVLATMLAARLADQGRKLLLVDGNQNLGSLHVLLGVRPTARLESLLLDEATPDDLLHQVTDNLWLLPGDSGAEALYALSAVDRARLHYRLSDLYERFDAVIIDAGPGLESVVRVATMRATRLLVVAAPEPAALTDAYALIKIVHQQVSELPIDVVANRALDEAEGHAAYEKLATATERFLRRGIRYLGTVPEDAAVRLAVRDPRRILQGGDPGPAAAAISRIIERLDLPLLVRAAS